MTASLAPRAAEPGFRHPFRVRFAECDPQGIVFNSRYLEYADMLVTEHWRAMGLSFAGAGSLDFNVVRAEVDYRAPIRADEMVEGRLWIDRIGNSSLALRIELHGLCEPPETVGAGNAVSGQRADLRTIIALVYVHIDVAAGRPLPLPDHVRSLLSAQNAMA